MEGKDLGYETLFNRKNGGFDQAGIRNLSTLEKDSWVALEVQRATYKRESYQPFAGPWDAGEEETFYRSVIQKNEITQPIIPAHKALSTVFEQLGRGRIESISFTSFDTERGAQDHQRAELAILKEKCGVKE